jgi:phage terminase small subunit
MKLTPKQEAFVNKYMECGNASEAYRFAYDVGEDTLSKTVNEAASHLLADNKVATRVSNLQKELALKNEYTRDRMIQEYFEIINLHKGLRDSFKGKKISGEDMKKVYALSNSGFVKGADVISAIDKVVKMMGLDKEDEKQQTAQTINNIQINIKRDRE